MVLPAGFAQEAAAAAGTAAATESAPANPPPAPTPPPPAPTPAPPVKAAPTPAPTVDQAKLQADQKALRVRMEKESRAGVYSKYVAHLYNKVRAVHTKAKEGDDKKKAFVVVEEVEKTLEDGANALGEEDFDKAYKIYEATLKKNNALPAGHKSEL